MLPIIRLISSKKLSNSDASNPFSGPAGSVFVSSCKRVPAKWKEYSSYEYFFEYFLRYVNKFIKNCKYHCLTCTCSGLRLFFRLQVILRCNGMFRYHLGMSYYHIRLKFRERNRKQLKINKIDETDETDDKTKIKLFTNTDRNKCFWKVNTRVNILSLNIKKMKCVEFFRSSWNHLESYRIVWNGANCV